MDRLAITTVWTSLLLIQAASLNASELIVRVENSSGKPVADAVIYVATDAGTPTRAPQTAAVIDQVDKEFIPYVTAVQVGSQINFPNNDAIRHHVYSFSPAKQFELPLYKGDAARPVLFEKVGVVALGCNIHDWMSSYVFVAATPWFAITDQNGVARLDLPQSGVALEVWHPRLKGEPGATRRQLAAGSKELAFRIEEKTLFRSFRGPGTAKAGY